MLPVKRFVRYILLLTPLPSRVAHLEAPQRCSCWAACPHSALYTVPLFFVLLTHLLAVCFICIYILLLSRSYEILTASTTCVYEAWNLIPSCNSKMPLQEQIVNGDKRRMPVTLSLSHISFVSVPLLPPPPGLGWTSRAFPRTVMAKFYQEYRKFALMQPWH